MKTITLTKKQLEKLTRIELPKEVANTESEIYLLDKGNWRYSDGSLLLKKLHLISGDSIANKLYNISLLGDNEERIGLDELVIPKQLVSVDNNVIGFTVPRIDGENLGVILHDYKVSNEDKIKYLYKVGKLLKKTKKMTNIGLKFNFGDLHEYNFLINENNELRAIDLDSCYLNTLNPSPSYYLNTNKNLDIFKDKYKKNDMGIVYPDDNSDLLCYIMMILNTIGREKISRLGVSDYFEYVNYLDNLGFGKDIIRSFQNIYSKTNNINPSNYLEQIPDDKIGEASFKVFNLKKKRGIL